MVFKVSNTLQTKQAVSVGGFGPSITRVGSLVGNGRESLLWEFHVLKKKKGCMHCPMLSLEQLPKVLGIRAHLTDEETEPQPSLRSHSWCTGSHSG